MKVFVAGLVFAILLGVGHGPAQAVVVDFEGLADLEVVTTQFSGVTFSNTSVLKSFFAATPGSLLDELFPPFSGENVASNCLPDDPQTPSFCVTATDPMRLDFSGPVSDVSGHFTYNAGPLILRAFNTSDIEIATATLTNAFLSNTNFDFDTTQCGISTSCTPNELLSVSFATGIAYVTIAGATDSSFTLDDLSFTPIPEPSALFLLASGLLGLLGGGRILRRVPNGGGSQPRLHT